MTTVNVNVTVTVDGVPQAPASPLRWNVGPVSEQTLPGPAPGVPTMQILKATQQVAIGVSAVDAKGNPAPISDVVFTSSATAVATVTQDADPTKALVKAVAPGTAQINVTCDGDVGEGVKTLTGTLDVTVQPGDAVAIVIATGTPEEQAPAA